MDMQTGRHRHGGWQGRNRRRHQAHLALLMGGESRDWFVANVTGATSRGAEVRLPGRSSPTAKKTMPKDAMDINIVGDVVIRATEDN